MVSKQLMDVAREKQTELIVMGLSGSVAQTLDTLSILRSVPKERVVETLGQARQAAQWSDGKTKPATPLP